MVSLEALEVMSRKCPDAVFAMAKLCTAHRVLKDTCLSRSDDYFRLYQIAYSMFGDMYTEFDWRSIQLLSGKYRDMASVAYNLLEESGFSTFSSRSRYSVVLLEILQGSISDICTLRDVNEFLSEPRLNLLARLRQLSDYELQIINCSLINEVIIDGKVVPECFVDEIVDVMESLQDKIANRPAWLKEEELKVLDKLAAYKTDYINRPSQLSSLESLIGM